MKPLDHESIIKKKQCPLGSSDKHFFPSVVSLKFMKIYSLVISVLQHKERLVFLNIPVLSTVCLQATSENMNFTNWAVWAAFSSNGNISNFFFHIFIGKKKSKLKFLYFVVSELKSWLIIKKRKISIWKISILALKLYFFGSK